MTITTLGAAAERIIADAAKRVVPSDQYNHWRRRLAGEDLGCEEAKPESGFYRIRNRPVAIWRDSQGVLIAKDGERTLLDELPILQLWGYCHMAPISHEQYRAAMAGEPWPDQHPDVVDRLHNRPPEGYELIRADIEDYCRSAQQLVAAGAAKSEDEAARADDLQAKLAELEKLADATRKAEKAPHEEAARSVDLRWNPVRDAARQAKRDIKSAVIEPWLLAKAAAERKALAEAAAATNSAPPAGPVKASTKTGRVALRSSRVARIDDPALFITYLAAMDAPPPELIEAAQRIANRMAAAGIKDMPGVEVTSQQKAA